jgi:hypothetical protein
MRYLKLFENFKEDDLKIKKYHKKGYKDNYFHYDFILNGKLVGNMSGYLENNIFNLNIIRILDEYKNKYLGEKFIIKFLKENTDVTIISDNELRKESADRMWQRISKNPDIVVDSENIKSHFSWNEESYNIYKAKLK